MNPAIVHLFFGATCIAFAPIFVRLADLEPTASAFYRCSIAFVLLCVYDLLLGKMRGERYFKDFFQKQYVIAGAIFSLDLFVWHKAVIYCGAGMSTLLANTQVFYLAVIGHFFFGERLTAKYLLCAAAGFAGISMLVLFNSEDVQFSHYSLGIALGLLTGLIYASYILSMRWIEKSTQAVDIQTKISRMSFWAAFFLFVWSLVEGASLQLQGSDIVYAFLLALVPQIAGWILITRSLGKVEVSLSGLMILLQPVFAFILAWQLLGEKLTLPQGIGVFLALAAIYLGEQVRRQAL